MEFARRAVGVVALGAAVATVTLLLERPVLLWGVAGIGGWLLARQWRFVADSRDAHDGLTVRHSPAREQVTAEGSIVVTLAASLVEPSALEVQVRATPPVGTRAPPPGERSVTLPAGDRRATATFPLTFPVAGQHSFEDATVALEDPRGLFASRVEHDSAAAVTAVPRTPNRVHVGEGGEQVAAFGAYGTDERGSGIEPAAIREYVPGDSAADIAWKATARLGEPYVREYDLETDRRALLVVDHRASMAAGPPGERKLDYARQVALTYLDAARRNDDPIGLLAVGEGGLTEEVSPATGSGHYDRLVRLVNDIEPTTDDELDSGATPDDIAARAPAEARRTASALDDDSAFSRTLRPFFSSSSTYVQRVTEDPLYAAVRSATDGSDGALVILVLTDDEHRAELREAADAAGANEDSVVVFMTPSVLFGGGDITDVEQRYDRLVDFESFRRDLASRPRTTAYEVGPEQQVETLLAAGRESR